MFSFFETFLSELRPKELKLKLPKYSFQYSTNRWRNRREKKGGGGGGRGSGEITINSVLNARLPYLLQREMAGSMTGTNCNSCLPLLPAPKTQLLYLLQREETLRHGTRLLDGHTL